MDTVTSFRACRSEWEFSVSYFSSVSVFIYLRVKGLVEMSLENILGQRNYGFWCQSFIWIILGAHKFHCRFGQWDSSSSLYGSVGLDLPLIEVRFQQLKVDAYIHVGSRALPTIPNFIINMAEVSYLLFLHKCLCREPCFQLILKFHKEK